MMGVSCGPPDRGSAPQLAKKGLALPDDPENPLGRKIYVAHCRLCHGLDGQMGGSGAANLAISLLTLEESKEVIAKGRNLMQSYENTLSVEEIDAVAQYIQLFKVK